MNIIERFRTFLAGFKTYLTAAASVIATLLGFATEQLDVVGLIAGLLAAFGLASLRAGVTNDVKKVVAAETTTE